MNFLTMLLAAATASLAKGIANPCSQASQLYSKGQYCDGPLVNGPFKEKITTAAMELVETDFKWLKIIVNNRPMTKASSYYTEKFTRQAKALRNQTASAIKSTTAGATDCAATFASVNEQLQHFMKSLTEMANDIFVFVPIKCLTDKVETISAFVIESAKNQIKRAIKRDLAPDDELFEYFHQLYASAKDLLVEGFLVRINREGRRSISEIARPIERNICDEIELDKKRVEMVQRIVIDAAKGAMEAERVKLKEDYPINFDDPDTYYTLAFEQAVRGALGMVEKVFTKTQDCRARMEQVAASRNALTNAFDEAAVYIEVKFTSAEHFDREFRDEYANKISMEFGARIDKFKAHSLQLQREVPINLKSIDSFLSDPSHYICRVSIYASEDEYYSCFVKTVEKGNEPVSKAYNNFRETVLYRHPAKPTKLADLCFPNEFFTQSIIQKAERIFKELVVPFQQFNCPSLATINFFEEIQKFEINLKKNCKANIRELERFMTEKWKQISILFDGALIYYPIVFEFEIEEHSKSDPKSLIQTLEERFKTASSIFKTRPNGKLPFELIQADNSLPALVHKIEELKTELLREAEEWAKDDPKEFGQLINNVWKILIDQLAVIRNAKIQNEDPQKHSCSKTFPQTYLNAATALKTLIFHKLDSFEERTVAGMKSFQDVFEIEKAFAKAVTSAVPLIASKARKVEAAVTACHAFHQRLPQMFKEPIDELLGRAFYVPVAVNTHSTPLSDAISSAYFEMLRPIYLKVFRDRLNITYKRLEHILADSNRPIKVALTELLEHLKGRAEGSLMQLSRKKENLNDSANFVMRLNELGERTYEELRNIWLFFKLNSTQLIKQMTRSCSEVLIEHVRDDDDDDEASARIEIKSILLDSLSPLFDIFRSYLKYQKEKLLARLATEDYDHTKCTNLSRKIDSYILTQIDNLEYDVGKVFVLVGPYAELLNGKLETFLHGGLSIFCEFLYVQRMNDFESDINRLYKINRLAGYGAGDLPQSYVPAIGFYYDESDVDYMYEVDKWVRSAARKASLYISNTRDQIEILDRDICLQMKLTAGHEETMARLDTIINAENEYMLSFVWINQQLNNINEMTFRMSDEMLRELDLALDRKLSQTSNPSSGLI